MKEACRILRPELELFAAGELFESSEMRRVRRHLDLCPDCRDLLVLHDEVTRGLLADGEESVAGSWSEREDTDESFLQFAGPFANEPRSRERCDRILERLDSVAPASRDVGDDGVQHLVVDARLFAGRGRAEEEVSASGAAEKRGPGRHVSRWRVARIAAAVLVVGLAVQLVFFSGAAVDAPSSSRTELVSRSARPASLAPGDLTRMRWVLGEDVRGTAAGGSVLGASTSRLPNARLVAVGEPESDAVPVAEARFVVDILTDEAVIRRLTVHHDREEMFYLVLEEDLLALWGTRRGDGTASAGSERYRGWSRWRRVVPVAASVTTSSERERADRLAAIGGEIYRVIGAPRRGRIDAGFGRRPIPVAHPGSAGPIPRSSTRVQPPLWRAAFQRF